MTEFIGHFHPVLVHLPIGILLIAVLFQFLSGTEKYQTLHSAIGISLFLGMLSAVASCISGYALAQTGDYEEELIARHQWLGIATAVVSMLAYFLYKNKVVFLKWVMLAMGVLIIITGHLGGSITHGSGYLTRALSTKDGSSNTTVLKPIADVQEAQLYAEVVKPILQSKCYSCHAAEKQKGKLRLDEPGFIEKGGKNGRVIAAGNTDESEMIKRILLPAENEDHMPPKEKPQLSKEDIALLHWWVSSGASFDKKVKGVTQNDRIKPLLAALQSGRASPEKEMSAIPAKPVEKAKEADMQKIKALGVVIVPVAENSNYLSANFITANFIDKDLSLLEPLKAQLIWLKLGNTKISDDALPAVAKLSNLTRLYLENTGITDAGLEKLKALSQLQYLNLVGTKITASGVLQLTGLKNLTQLYVYKTGVAGLDHQQLKAAFPKATIDTGGYRTQMLATDTQKVKPPL